MFSFAASRLRAVTARAARAEERSSRREVTSNRRRAAAAVEGPHGHHHPGAPTAAELVLRRQDAGVGIGEVVAQGEARLGPVDRLLDLDRGAGGLGASLEG